MAGTSGGAGGLGCEQSAGLSRGDEYIDHLGAGQGLGTTSWVFMPHIYVLQYVWAYHGAIACHHATCMHTSCPHTRCHPHAHRPPTHPLAAHSPDATHTSRPCTNWLPTHLTSPECIPVFQTPEATHTHSGSPRTTTPGRPRTHLLYLSSYLQM